MQNTENDFKELREVSGMNKTKFANYFGIPYRTLIAFSIAYKKRTGRNLFKDIYNDIRGK